MSLTKRSMPDSECGQDESDSAFCPLDITIEEWRGAYRPYFEALDAAQADPAKLQRIVALGPFGLANTMPHEHGEYVADTAGVDPRTLAEAIPF